MLLARLGWQVLMFLVTAVLLISMYSCNLPKLPSPEEVEEIFVGMRSTVIEVDPEQVNLPAIRTQKIMENGGICLSCHPEDAVDPTSNFRATHIAEYGGKKDCQNCHSTKLPRKKAHATEDEVGVGLSFSHRTHLDGQLECRACHVVKVHTEGLAAPMRVCLECHKSEGGPRRCSACHTKPESIFPDFHKGVNIQKTHGKIALGGQYDCKRCHVEPNYCIDCHKIEMPHPIGYLQRHNAEVKGKPETCVRCHGDKPCITCHTERGVFSE